MATIQTSYDLNPPVGRAGMIADGVPATCRTYVNGGTADIAFGVAVQRDGNSATDAVVGVAGDGSSPFSATDYLGITVEDRTREDEEKAYKAGANMTVITKGDVWVKVGAAVTAGAPVAARDGTGVLITAAAASAARIPRAVFKTAAANGGLAIVSLGTDQVG